MKKSTKICVLFFAAGLILSSCDSAPHGKVPKRDRNGQQIYDSSGNEIYEDENGQHYTYYGGGYYPWYPMNNIPIGNWGRSAYEANPSYSFGGRSSAGQSISSHGMSESGGFGGSAHGSSSGAGE